MPAWAEARSPKGGMTEDGTIGGRIPDPTKAAQTKDIRLSLLGGLSWLPCHDTRLPLLSQ